MLLCISTVFFLLWLHRIPLYENNLFDLVTSQKTFELFRVVGYDISNCLSYSSDPGFLKVKPMCLNKLQILNSFLQC